MSAQPSEHLARKRCVACEGGVARYTPQEAEEQVRHLAGWRLTHGGLRIRKDWTVRSFRAGTDFLARVAELAEAEGHHPDLHLEAYRNVWIELWTHAVGGLSKNDFILAAKIDQVPVALKT